MADSSVDDDVGLEKARLRDLFSGKAMPTDSQVEAARSTLNSARSFVKAAKQLERERTADHQENNRKRKETAGEKRDHLTLLLLLDQQIQALETRLSDRYGEDFAENLAAEYLDEETYLTLMAIEDQSERRHAIAVAISEGIANGKIDAEEINRDPELLEWLNKNAEKRDLRQEYSLQSELAVHDQESEHSLTSGLDTVFKV